MTDAPAIEITRLVKKFGDAVALDGIELAVPRGSVFGFLGPNGAGKTTALRILTGLARPTSGEARILGADVSTAGNDVRSQIGYLPDVPGFYPWMTAVELVEYAGRLFGIGPATVRERAESLLEMAGLSDVRTKVGGFSRGMKQRLGIAQALINAPSVLLLDEPTSALDPIGRREVLEMIASLRGRTTVFFSTHILADVESISDRVAMVFRGKIEAVGAPRELAGRALQGTDVAFRIDDPRGAAADEIAARGSGARRGDQELTVALDADADVDEVLAFARERGARVVAVTPRHATLEDLFVARAKETSS